MPSIVIFMVGARPEPCPLSSLVVMLGAQPEPCPSRPRHHGGSTAGAVPPSSSSSWREHGRIRAPAVVPRCDEGTAGAVPVSSWSLSSQCPRGHHGQNGAMLALGSAFWRSITTAAPAFCQRRRVRRRVPADGCVVACPQTGHRPFQADLAVASPAKTHRDFALLVLSSFGLRHPSLGCPRSRGGPSVRVWVLNKPNKCGRGRPCPSRWLRWEPATTTTEVHGDKTINYS